MSVIVTLIAFCNRIALVDLRASFRCRNPPPHISVKQQVKSNEQQADYGNCIESLHKNYVSVSGTILQYIVAKKYFIMDVLLRDKSMKRILFICSQNKLRSPTAEQIFSLSTDIEVSSAGTNHDAENPLDREQIEWADIIIVMERTHRNKIQKRFRGVLHGKRIIVLDIPDDYEFMDPELIRLLRVRMGRVLPV